MRKTNANKKTNDKNKTIYLGVSFILLTIIAIFASAGMANAAQDAPLITITLLNQDPLPAKAGDIAVLKFQVQNMGGVAAESVKINFQQDYPFTLIKGDASQTISLGAYQGGDNSVVISYTVQIAKDIQRGSYPLTINYGTGSSLSSSLFDISTQNKEYAQIGFVNKAEVSPGQETDLNFTITNVGSAPLQNLVFSWNEPTGSLLPVYSDNTRYIKYLDAGQSTTASYTVIADTNAKQGLYKLNLNLDYESVGNTTATTLATTAGVFIGGQTDFDVAFSESSSGTTSLSVSNTGNNPAYSVSVKIPSQQNYRVQGSTSAIIGNLDKGDYTLVSFQIAQATTNFSGSNNATRQAGGTRPTTGQGQTNFTRQLNRTGLGFVGNDLLVTIEYTDTTGARLEVNKSVPIQFKTTGTTGFTGTAGRPATTKTSFIGSTVFWIIIVVIVGVGVYYFSKRKATKDGKKQGK